jgi:putative membrane protein
MSDAVPPRKPALFEPDDPAVVEVPPEREPSADPLSGQPAPAIATPTDEVSKFGWGTALFSALGGLAAIAAGIWFARFVSVAFGRDDWIGWSAITLASIAGVAALVLLVREIIGLWRLQRLDGLRKAADQAVLKPDLEAEAKIADRLTRLFSGRPELAWSLSRFRQHQRDIRDPGDLLVLADRELLAPLDIVARRTVMTSCRRVATVTAMSPWALIAFFFVVFESLRMMRNVAAVYGGRPGFFGAFRLARVVTGNLIASGGVALTDDLLGQFLGQDVLHRLSRRLGEGAFNGALVARLGTAAIDVARPLPFIVAPPVRARDFLVELFRKTNPGGSAPKAKGTN